MRRFTLLFATLLSLLGVTQVKADEITVYDGTGTNSYVPVAGYYADTNNQKVEIIYPASALSGIAGVTISQIQFYVSSSASAVWGATYEVFVKEVNQEAFDITSSYYSSNAIAIGNDGATTVYTGTLDATGSTMTIPFDEGYEYNGGNLLVGIYMKKAGNNYPNASFYGEESTNGSWCYYSSSSGNKPQSFIPKTTFTYQAATPGPKFAAYDGSTKLTTGYVYNFGLATSGSAKAFTLKNSGTEDLTISVSETGDFNATLSATTITAGGEVTLTVTMPETTGSSAVTITPDATSGIEPFVINVSGTIRDANKVYEYGFTALPTDWTTTGTWYYSEANGAYNTSWYLSSNARLITPQLTISEGEVFFVEAKGYSTSNTSYQHLQMQYSADGSTWTNFDSEPTLDPSNWQTFSFTGVPAGKYYIAINASQADVRMFYGGELPNEPKMVVTQPTSLDFGAITENTTKTFTIANTGRATLEGINVTSSNEAFTITGAPTSLEAGASQEVTITMSTANTGALSSDITVSATGMENVTFTVTGVVLPEGMFVVDFNDNALPEGWTNASWTFANGEATGKSYSAYLTTPKLVFSEGDILVIKAKRSDSDASDYITVQGSSDNGSTWTAYTKKISGSNGLAYPDYSTIVLSDIPTTVNKLRFVGFYVIVDEIAGLTYAPVLNVTTGDPATAVSSPASYDFGECATDAYVTYNFTNAGAGTININNVTITGEGAAAYSTNWTESTAAPFELKITRTYDATRTEAQAAVITVTTSEGEFIINVTGTDKAANAPELAVDVTSLDFGKLTADDTKTVTVTNNGTGLLTVNIASDSEDFVVSAATLESIAAGESKTFDVTFKFSTNYGVKSGNITVTPTYDTEAVQTIAVTAKALDPDMWTEYFEGNALPTGWEAGSNWSFADGVAKAAYAYGSTKYYLTTPKLEVSATTDELAFDYLTTSGNVNIKIQMSKDGGEWETCNTTPALATYMSNGTSGTATITGLEPGIYQFRFANDDYQLDNFEGFKLKAAAAHEAEVANGGLTIPTTGNQYVEYTASVNVKVTGTNDEELTVKFFIGDTQYGEAVTKNVASNTTETFEVTFTPDAAVNGDAYFTIESTDITAFQSNTVAVTIAAATVLDETVAPELTEGTVPSLLLKYTRYNGWNTICVPFELNSGILKTIFGKGWKAYEFKGYSDGTLNFETATTFVAGYPYIIYVENAQTNTDDIVLLNVNISRLTAQYDTYNNAYFRGSYAPIAAPDMNGLWGITSEGRIAKGTAESSIDGFRAYFELPSTTTGAPLLSIDGGPATRIHSIDNGQLTIDNAYDLSGRRVAQPSKGLYIINGKKVVIK